MSTKEKAEPAPQLASSMQDIDPDFLTRYEATLDDSKDQQLATLAAAMAPRATTFSASQLLAQAIALREEVMIAREARRAALIKEANSQTIRNAYIRFKESLKNQSGFYQLENAVHKIYARAARQVEEDESAFTEEAIQRHETATGRPMPSLPCSARMRYFG
ncbi:MAG: hypothetical protein HC767_06815 [Akkermansiaceae bacterium]|nr:hypothetical protein [Akkermansiaceae bacterium]